MANYREILRLHSLGSSRRSIAREVKSSRDTVAEAIKAAEAAGIAWPLDDDITNDVNFGARAEAARSFSRGVTDF